MMDKKWWLPLFILIVLNGCQNNVNNSINCVQAGCSSQLCVLEEEAKNIITTCEAREEYKCFEFSKCGYFDGECKWKETPEYLRCLEGVE